jgi:hypothetical protein
MEAVVGDCPLGAKCEEVKVIEGKQKIVRCPWYVRVSGTNPNTGEDIDSWNCAIAWMPMLQINVANEARKGVAATESFRNEVVGVAQKQLPSH